METLQDSMDNVWCLEGSPVPQPGTHGTSCRSAWLHEPRVFPLPPLHLFMLVLHEAGLENVSQTLPHPPPPSLGQVLTKLGTSTLPHSPLSHLSMPQPSAAQNHQTRLTTSPSG